MGEKSKDKYCFETFQASHSEFDSRFSDFLNSRYHSGWEYENCQFTSEGDNRIAYCVFEKD